MKLSVVVPVYNVEKYLAKCLDSLIHPELDGYEIIAVNDGSTDASPAILEDYSRRYPELIRVIHRENGGLGAARNTGADAACGEYILFVDSDDYLLPEAISQLLTKCDEDYDIVFFGSVPVNEAGGVIGNTDYVGKEGVFSLADYPELLFCTPSACNKLVRRSLYSAHSVSFPGRVWYEDIRTMPKLYLWAKKCTEIKKPFYRYLLRQGSIMNSGNISRNTEIIDALDDLRSYYALHDTQSRYLKQLEYMAFYHQYICAVVRVCLADRKSPVASVLRDDFISKHPNYRSNPYVLRAPAKYKLLDRLISLKMYSAVSFIMGLNSRIR